MKIQNITSFILHLTLSDLLKKLLTFLVIFFGFIFCFYNLGSPALQRWDEQTNAEVVRSLVEENTFPYLKIRGDNFYEKPPLWYYLTGVCVKVLGFNNISLRIISAISGFILLICIMIFTKKYFGRVASIFSGLSFITTGQLFITNPALIFSSHNIRSADVDILQLLFMFLTIWAIFEYENSKELKFLIGISVFTALAFLTKGLMAFLPILVWILWIIYLNKGLNLKRIFTREIVFLIIHFQLLILPWYLFMYLNFGNEFLSAHFGYHNFGRFSTPLEGHVERWDFHLINLLNPAFFVCGIFFYYGLYRIVRLKKFRRFEYFFLLLYSILILTIITLTQTKLAWYLLYIYPIATIVVGSNLENYKINWIGIIKLFS